MDLAKFVHNSIYEEARKAGSSSKFARRNAEIGEQMYRRSNHGERSVSIMIKNRIDDAVKETKAFNKAKGK